MGAVEWDALMPPQEIEPRDGSSGGGVEEQSILRLIMGDLDDDDPSSLGLNKLLHSTTTTTSSQFPLLDRPFDPLPPSSTTPSAVHDFSFTPSLQLRIPPSPSTPLFPIPSDSFPLPLPPKSLDVKFPNPHLRCPHNYPPFFVPFPGAPGPAGSASPRFQDAQVFSPSPPPLKRLNTGATPPSPSDPRSDVFRHQHRQQRAVAAGCEESGNQQQFQQAIIEQMYKAVEMIETGNPLLAQGILARLNHQLSPLGNPFHRAAFYLKEALHSLLHASPTDSSLAASPPFTLIYKIGAYKSFSEISPVLQFANFTCNQAFLEALDGCDRVHVLSFDIGYGGQWASLMQELALRNGGPPSLKITAFASPSTHDELELALTQENLKHFASDINMELEFEVLNLESLNSSSSWPLSLHFFEGEAIAVNMPISSFTDSPALLPMVLRFIKQLNPKVVVSLDRVCDRSDIPLSHHVIHALQYYSSLLESLDAVNVSLDILQKIEMYLLQPAIEKIVTGNHQQLPERVPCWRSLFSSGGFSPVPFSNFNESQAECLVQRTPVRGFHVEKRHYSLVLCWQRKELLSASAWKCC
ncbi:hypothetical protein MLD38_027128 [Melastoma candidum]|uniref:Uncharacterized protein n=1 Tax=Melastoma candidum TaxID=119954 RepID=A0ACB9P2L8_9MYRT|nr:hypothetical protein MLD38_027128 [Melastoma candidum]